MKKLRPFYILILLIFSFFFAYFIKCQLGICLIKNFPLDKYPPLSWLQNRNSPNMAYAQVPDVNSKEDWGDFWIREAGMAKLGHDSQGLDNSGSLVITSQSAKDWSLSDKKMIEAVPGDNFSFSGLVKTSDRAVGELSVVLYDADKQVRQWSYAKASVTGSVNWQEVKQEFIIPPEVKYIRFRLTGHGEGKAWFDKIKLKKVGGIVLSSQSIWSLENPYMKFIMNMRNGQWIVEDKRSSMKWETTSTATDFLVTKASQDASQLQLEMINSQTMESFTIVISLDPQSPEISFSINRDPEKELSILEFPAVPEIKHNDKVVLPLSEGFLFDYQTAAEIIPSSLQYRGGWPMAFVGATEGDVGWMEIVETPFDFQLIKDLGEGMLNLKNRWLSQKGKFGYKRQVRYIFFDKGGYVAMAKRYRQYAIAKGLLKTLKNKNGERNGNIEKMIGAMDVWYWGKDTLAFIQELKKSGINKALISRFSGSLDIHFANSDGYLSSRYDLYQDVWPPADYDVTRQNEGWPDDLVLDEKGNWIKGWDIKKDEQEYPGGVISSKPGLERAKKEIPEDLKDHPYTARFIDTTTASPWREDYNPLHPLTRSEDLKYRMALLGFCSNKLGLVTGSEDGVDAAVPFADYFEGMMSPGFARLPDSGYDVAAVKYIIPNENFLKYQIGEKYRIPLWDLVFHDSVVATWYWGDSSNRIPEVWWRRDLFNILYGNTSLWAIRDWDYWKKYKNRFIESYNNISPVFEKVGWAEMLTHRFMTMDHTVQEVTFNNNVRILVNFGSMNYILEYSKIIVPSHGFVVFENGKIWKQGVCS